MSSEDSSSSKKQDSSKSERRPGEAFECLSIPVEITKTPQLDEKGNVKLDENGEQIHYCGFSIGGGIDQDHKLSPQKYPDNGIYVTAIKSDGPAAKSNLCVNDKILQVNGYDFTIVTHKQAIDIIKKREKLFILVLRKDQKQNKE